MKWHVHSLVILIGTLICSTVSGVVSQAGHALPATEISKIAKSITVLIDGQDPGSGVLFSKDGSSYYVLTANHVVQYPDLPYVVQTPDQKRYPVDYQKIRRLPGVDLAVVTFKSKEQYKVAKLTDSDQVTEGSPVFIGGFPNPGEGIKERFYRFTEGVVSGRPTKPLPGGYALIYSNITRAGFSGGPVLDANGRLLGIHGQGEADNVSSNEAGQPARIKTGFNMGIPINTFITLVTKSGLNLHLSIDNSTSPTAVTPSSHSPQIGNPIQIPSPTNASPTPSTTLTPPPRIRPTNIPQSPICAGTRC